VLGVEAGVSKMFDVADFPAGSEDNDLETDGAANIADTEIPIGTGAGTVNYAALSGAATMTNAGVVIIPKLDYVLDDTTNWKTAYGWGDWSTEVGYIADDTTGWNTTETKLAFVLDDTTNWQTAYGWGDWSTEVGYIADDTTGWNTTETKLAFVLDDTTTWNTAYLLLTATADSVISIVNKAVETDVDTTNLASANWEDFIQGHQTAASGGSAFSDSVTHDGKHVIGDSLITDAEGLARFQPLEATLTDIADGTIAENLVNTDYPWADNEVADDITITKLDFVLDDTTGWNTTETKIAFILDDTTGWNTTETKLAFVLDDTTNWQSAYGWGDWSTEVGYIADDTTGWNTTETKLAFVLDDTTGWNTTETKLAYVLDDTTNWNTAYGWGDWSTAVGYIADDTTGWNTTETKLAYVLDDTTNWQSAYGWGDWSTEVGYIADDTTGWNTTETKLAFVLDDTVAWTAKMATADFNDSLSAALQDSAFALSSELASYLLLTAVQDSVASLVADSSLLTTTAGDAAYEAELNNSEGLLAALSDETGTGVAVFGTNPTFTTGVDLPADAINSAGELGTDVVTMDAVDADGNFTTLTGNIRSTGEFSGGIQDTIVTDSLTIPARFMYGGVIYVTGTSLLTLPAVADGMNFSVITIGAVLVELKPDADDLFILDGTALSDEDKAANTSTTGDLAVITYYNATGFYVASGSNDGDLWTDAN